MALIMREHGIVLATHLLSTTSLHPVNLLNLTLRIRLHMLSSNHLSHRLHVLTVDLLMLRGHLLLHHMIELGQILRLLELLVVLNISVVIIIDTADLPFYIGSTNNNSS